MARTWVLDSGTKGTGASIVPLEKAPAKPDDPLALVPLGGVHPEPAPAPEAAPHTFKVVDVVSGQVVAEDAPAADTVRALDRFGSVVDVRVYVRDPDDDRWRRLTLREVKVLWALRGRTAP